ncbi:hypothetical protein WME95_34585 [Sorangium sp. So ce327]|uniref:hypothetical protein n=1 Tax=Sorangium sp. So ce327 TaxID=3133301 RepID=UPI003F60C4EB
MRQFTFLARLSPLALTLLTAAGCGGIAPETQADPFMDHEPGAEEPSDPAAKPADVTTGPVVALTSIQREKAPLLAELMDGAPSRFRADLIADPSPASRLAEASAVLIDAEAASADDIRSYASLLRAARLAGVPVILENARDAEKVALALGIGMSAQVVYAAPSPGGQHFDVRVFGDVTGEETEEHSSVRLPASAKARYARMTAGERAELGMRLERSEAELDALFDAAPEAEPITIDAKPRIASMSEVAQAALPARGELLAEIKGLLADHKAHAPAQLVTEPLPEGTYRSYNVTSPSITWECGGDGQRSVIDRNFTVTLLASNAPEGKYVVFAGNGTQYNPGGLKWNSGNNRGYFQETLQHSIRPLSGGLSPYAHRPHSANESSTFTTSNGFSVGAGVGAEGPSTSFSLDASQQASRSLNDFDVIDFSSGSIFGWQYKLASVSGHPYKKWEDLHNDTWGGLYGLPNLAKSTLTDEYEGIYVAGLQDQSLYPVENVNLQSVRHTWVSHDYVLWEEIKTTSCGKAAGSVVTVDLSSVNVAKLGTIPFRETFDQGVASGVWTAINEGITDSSSNWRGAGGAATETGSAFDYPQTAADGAVDMRGTYLVAPRTAFGQGALSAKIYAGDPDGFGLMYAINDTGSSYYRVMFDASLSVARLVRVDNGVFTELAVNTSYVPPQNAWMTVRVEREGTTHRIKVNDQVVLAVASEATYAWGSVALFSWAMSDVRFDDVTITTL